MEGISLGSAFLRLYGDRSALDRELETLRRYTDQLEKQGIKVKFDADTGQASREIDQLQNRLNGLNQILAAVGHGLQGDGNAFQSLAETLSSLSSRLGASGGALGGFSGALSGVMGAATRALPVLGQIGLAAQGLQAIFFGVSAAVNSVIGPLQQLSQEAGRFNQQVAEAGIFTSQSFGILGPDGKAIEGTANQMRAVRGVITKEYKEIQKEVAKISGATASEIYEGFNLILQNSQALGEEGESLGNMRKLATRLAAATNVLGIPGDQYRSEVSSLLTGDIQMYDQLAKKLGYDRETVERLKSEGKYYEDLMQKLEKLYQGQEVLSASLSNVQSNFEDVFQTISTEGGQALERGLAGGLKAVLDALDNLQGSFAGAMRGFTEALEPILRILGEVGGWLVSLGSMVASLGQIIGDFAAVQLNLIGLGILPILKAVGGILQVIAKVFELVAAAASTAMRPISVFFRVLTGQTTDSMDSFFDGILKFFDDLIVKTEQAAALVARPFLEMAKGVAWLQGKLRGMTAEEIAQRQAVIESEFATSLGGADEPELRSLNLSDSTKKLLDERAARLGSGSTRRLNEYKEISQLVQDRVKNEIQGLEQALRLMGAQKNVQQALNELAESRRGLESNRANFAIQVAASPEARLAAEENRNDLAARQEQERINERRALLGTEKEMLQMQLQIQLKQQRLQQEQLRIQRLEIQIQKEKAQAALADIQSRMQVVRASSPEFKALARQRTEAQAELRLRSQQLEIVDRTVDLGDEMVGVIQQTNALEGRTLDIKGQQLGIQEQLAGATREQQAQLAELQRQEQEITAERDKQLEAGKELIRKGESQLRNIEEQQKAARELEQLDRARAELRKNQADAAVQEAEALLKVAQAQQQATESPTSVQAVIGARIEALAVGAQGFVSEAEATRKVYEARQRQLQQEQEQQRKQLQIQQDRERAELQLVALRMQVETQRAVNTRIELQAQQQLLQLQQQRDAISASVVSTSAIPNANADPMIGQYVGRGVPPAPMLPPPPGRAGAAITARQRALLDTIAYAEGTYNPNGYRTMFTGRLFSDLSRHPRQINRSGNLASDAAGRYQFLSTTWRSTAQAIGAGDFGPQNQDLGALYLAGRRGVNTDAPLSLSAIARLAPEWASFPTSAGRSAYAGQGAKRADDLLRFYNQRLATFSGMPESALQSPTVPGFDPAVRATSLQNSIDSNANLQKENNEALQRSTETIERLNNQTLPRLDETQALQRDALATSQRAKQEELRIQAFRDQVTAEVLKTGRGRLAAQLTESTAGSLGNSLRGLVSQLFSGQGIDLAGLTENITRTMAERVTGALLEAALAPMEKALTENLFRAFSGVDVDAVAQEQMRAAEIQLEAAKAQERAAGASPAAAAPAVTSGGISQTDLGNGMTLTAASGAVIPPEVLGEAIRKAGGTGGASSYPSFEQIWGATGGPALVPLAESAAGLSQSMDGAAQTIDVVATTAGRTAGGFEGLMANLGRIGAVLGGITMGVGGAQQMGKGGTYNTLMGLAGIFGSIGSIAGLFGGPRAIASGGSALAGFTAPDLGLGAQFGITGGFGGFRAMGGPVTSNRAYMVGERGPELFVPNRDGEVYSNSVSNAFLASRSALGGAGAAPEDAAFTEARDALGIAPSNAFNAARSALEATSTVLRERQTERVLAATLNGPTKPMTIAYEAQVINNVEYVSADQFRRGLSDAAERGRALTLASLRNSVKTRRQVGI